MIQAPAFWLALVVGPFLYWRTPAASRGWMLAVISLFATSIARPEVVLFPLLAVAFYLADKHLERRAKLWVFYSICLLMLITKPYLGLVFDSRLAPVGISFLAFRFIHLALEVSRGTIVINSLQQLLAWSTFAPILTAGPIERFDHFWENADTEFHWDQVREGTQRILIGIVKKGVVANLLFGPLFLSERPYLSEDVAIHEAWIWVLASFWFGYLDFSAYSDIAIGSSRLFGFRVVENFNFPFLATNLAEFWRRWHMSLMNLCRNIIYMPMIFMTRSQYRAIFATFLVMGLWHGLSLNWVAWALWHACGMALYATWFTWATKRRIKLPDHWALRLVGAVTTVMFVSASGAFIVTDDIWQALNLLGQLVGL